MPNQAIQTVGDVGELTQRERYEMEKANGKRRPNGALALKKLSPLHIEIVKAHLDGVRNTDIAAMFRMTDSTISLILSDPLVEEIRAEWLKDRHAEFNALYGRAINTIRDSMNEDKPALVRLRAAKMVMEDAPFTKSREDGRETAEDVVQRILQVNIQINNGGQNGSA